MRAALGLGVVGCGGAAAALCRAAHVTQAARVAATFDTDPSRAAALAASCGAVAYESVDELLADDGVEMVYVAVPHADLSAHTERALMAGRHTLAEKPLALDPATATRLGTLAADRGVRLGVYFVLRESPAVRWCREAIAAGAVGALRMIRVAAVIDKPETYWIDPSTGAPNWRASKQAAGGGVLLMNVLHQIDAIRFMTGLSFVRACGDIATVSAGVEVEDQVAAALRMSDGTLVSVTASARSSGARREETISIDGTEGRIDVPYQLGTEPIQLHLERPWQQYPEGWSTVAMRPGSCYDAALVAFADAVRDGHEPRASARDAAAGLDVVAAIYESARSGRSVDIPITP